MAASKVGQGRVLQDGNASAAGEVGVGAGAALESDHVGHANILRTRARSAGRVDPERCGGHAGAADAHPGLQRPQLLQPLALFERRRRQADEPGERLPPPGVDPEMVPERARAVRHHGAGEIKGGRQLPARREGADGLHDGRRGGLVGALDGRHQRADVVPRHRAEGRAQIFRRQGRQVALEVHHHVVPSLRVELAQGGVDPVGAGGEVGIGHHRGPAGAAHGVGDLRLAAGDRDRSDGGLLGEAEHADDHGRCRRCRPAACPAGGSRPSEPG